MATQVTTATPDTVYATKGNIAFPGTAAQAAVALARAESDLNARHDSTGGRSIKVAN